MPPDILFEIVLGCAPLTSHVLIRGDKGYIVHKDGTEHFINCITMEFAMAQVEAGSWKRVDKING